MRKRICIVFFGLFLAGQVFAAKDTFKEAVGESRAMRLRKPTVEFHEKEDGLEKVLPDLAREKLLNFEDRLLAHRKAKRAQSKD